MEEFIMNKLTIDEAIKLFDQGEKILFEEENGRKTILGNFNDHHTTDFYTVEIKDLLKGKFYLVQRFNGTGENQPYLKSMTKTLHEKELVLNQTDSKDIMKTVDIAKNFIHEVKKPKFNDLSIKLETRLNVSEEENIAVKNFTYALKQLPKQLSLDVGIDGSFSSTGDLKLNLETFIVDMVKEHFKV
jgi:hypothetical protein